MTPQDKARIHDFVARIEVTLCWIEIDQALQLNTAIIKRGNGTWRTVYSRRPNDHASQVSLSTERVLKHVSGNRTGSFLYTDAVRAKQQLVECITNQWPSRS